MEKFLWTVVLTVLIGSIVFMIFAATPYWAEIANTKRELGIKKGSCPIGINVLTALEQYRQTRTFPEGCVVVFEKK